MYGKRESSCYAIPTGFHKQARVLRVPVLVYFKTAPALIVMECPFFGGQAAFLGSRGSVKHGENGRQYVVNAGKTVKVNPGTMQDTNVVIRQRINIDAKDLIFRVRIGSRGSDRHVISP